MLALDRVKVDLGKVFEKGQGESSWKLPSLWGSQLMSSLCRAFPSYIARRASSSRL
jgi:hypothetical protein